MKSGLGQWRWPGAVAIALAAALVIFTPALAQGGTGGDITLDEDVSGNQYLFGDAVTVNGDVDGDLTVFARSLTVNGTVSGDVLFGGSWLLLNGTVDGDIRGAGGMLILDDDAQVTGDLMGAGYSVEMRPGSVVDGQLLAAGKQVILENVGKDVKIGAASLRVNGTVGGDVNASVGGPDQPYSSDPFAGMRNQDPDMPSAATIPNGLTFGDDASIDGNLDYESTTEASIPSGVVAGKTSFTLETAPERETREQGFFETDAGRATGYFLSSLIVLTLCGALLQRIRPAFLSGSADTLRKRVLASFGVGLLGYVVFFGVLLGLFILLFVLVLPLSFFAMGGRFFGAIALTGLTSSTAFVILTNWLAPMVVGLVIGEWVYSQIQKDGKSPFWSLVIGLTIVLLAISTPVVGQWLVAGLVAVFGLGAVILHLLPNKPAPAVEAPPAEPAAAK